MHVLRKLSWRARFLRDPAGFLADRWDHIQRPGLRSALLEEAAATPARVRLGMLGRGSDVAELRPWLLRRLRRDGEGPWFDLGDVRLYFHPEHVPPHNEGPLEGALWMIDEAFVDRPEFMDDDTTARPGDVVLDLGGNLGTSALLLAERMSGRGRIVSFEPVFHALLRRNLAANSVEGVEVVPAAVGAAPGTATFAVTDFGLDSRLNTRGTPERTVDVPLTTVDDEVAARALERVDLIKMDVEGAEEQALLGARRILERHRPRLSISSYHTDPEGDAQHPKLVARLRAWGYTVREIATRHIHAHATGEIRTDVQPTADRAHRTPAPWGAAGRRLLDSLALLLVEDWCALLMPVLSM